MKINAAVTWGENEGFHIEEIDLAEPNANEVLIEVIATGVCHTDAAAAAGHMGVPFPMVFGHEASGIVKKVGAGVTKFTPGDAVVVACCKCDHCDPCLTGEPGSCENIPVLNFGGAMEDGTRRIFKGEQEISTFFGQSTFATYAVTNEKNLVKVENDENLELYGPFGCGIATGSATVLECLKPRFASTIAVYGCGGVGLSAIMASKIAGCAKIIAVDINAERLELAKELGATHIVNSKDGDTVELIREITDGHGVDYGVECSGKGFIAKQALSALKKSGELALIGAGYEPTEIDLNTEFLFGTKKLVGYIAGKVSSQYFVPKLIEYHKMGKFPFEKMVKFYDFEDIEKAFADSASGKTIKPILRIKK